MSKITHLKAILAFPFTAIVIFPLVIWFFSHELHLEWELEFPFNVITAFVGLIISFIGFVLLVQTIYLFASIGKGTLSPWDPPKKLVVNGPYRYVRNPMMVGFLLIIFAEVIMTSSYLVFIYFICIFITYHIVIIKSEEPGLFRRFGEEYMQYSKHVPRWIPRLTPWKSNHEKNR